MQHAAIDERDAKKRMIVIFAGFAEIFEPRMVLRLFHGDRPHLLGDKSRQAFVQRHAQRADALRAQAHRGRQHQIRAVRLQQIGGANIGLEAAGDQRNHVHQRLGGFAALLREIRDFF